MATVLVVMALSSRRRPVSGTKGPPPDWTAGFARYVTRVYGLRHARKDARGGVFVTIAGIFLSRSTRHHLTPSLAPRSDVLRVSPRVVPGGPQHASSSTCAVEAIARPIMTPLAPPPRKTVADDGGASSW